MGCDLDDLKNWAKDFKEKLSYYLECNKHKLPSEGFVLKTNARILMEYIESMEEETA